MKIQQTIDSGSDTIDQQTVHCPYCPSACTHYKPVRPSQLLPSACSSRHFAGIDQIAPREPSLRNLGQYSKFYHRSQETSRTWPALSIFGRFWAGPLEPFLNSPFSSLGQ